MYQCIIRVYPAGLRPNFVWSLAKKQSFGNDGTFPVCKGGRCQWLKPWMFEHRPPNKKEQTSGGGEVAGGISSPSEICSLHVSVRSNSAMTTCVIKAPASKSDGCLRSFFRAMTVAAWQMARRCSQDFQTLSIFVAEFSANDLHQTHPGTLNFQLCSSAISERLSRVTCDAVDSVIQIPDGYESTKFVVKKVENSCTSGPYILAQHSFHPECLILKPVRSTNVVVAFHPGPFQDFSAHVEVGSGAYTSYRAETDMTFQGKDSRRFVKDTILHWLRQGSWTGPELARPIPVEICSLRVDLMDCPQKNVAGLVAACRLADLAAEQPVPADSQEVSPGHSDPGP